MGTHPIFESDFDCLTDFKMSEVEDEKSWEDFCQKMKKATRSVHDLQDATIQALFVATLYVGGSQDLWFQALARFELVFNELEDCLDCQKKIQDFDVPGMRVSQYIKEDLDEYYGDDRKPCSSHAVNKWMKEIRAIRFDHPYLITAYIYHMYLGLHTGAKILRQKFKLKGKTLELDAKLNIKEGLKASMKNLILEQPDLKEPLIEHSKNLFRLNNGIIQECENKNIELIKLFGLFILSGAAFVGFIKMLATK